MTKRRECKTYSDEFKMQMIKLYNAGKLLAEIIREYELSPTSLNSWIKRINATGSAKECDNRSLEELELIKLRKENKQLRMENDILKQAALIFAQR